MTASVWPPALPPLPSSTRVLVNRFAEAAQWDMDLLLDLVWKFAQQEADGRRPCKLCRAQALLKAGEALTAAVAAGRGVREARKAVYKAERLFIDKLITEARSHRRRREPHARWRARATD